jgi:cytochrome c5
MRGLGRSEVYHGNSAPAQIQIFRGKTMNKAMLVLAAALFSTTAISADQAVVDKYNKSCIACHSSGAAGAPKTGVEADWTPRMGKGTDALVASVVNGMNAMPPKGMCFDCSNEDFKALIEYMATPK